MSEILLEAAAWLQERGMPLWREEELASEDIQNGISDGIVYIAEWDGVPAGTFRFQLSDLDFWPDVPEGESAFIHRLAVRRRFAGGTVSSAILAWAGDRAAALGRTYLRLDCEASRPKLRAVYERAGFTYHSSAQVGPFLVARYELKL